MPLYEHDCARCGTFTLLRPMSEAGDAAACPTCGQAATRRYSVPGGSLVSPATRAAHERNERSAHEPARMRRGATSPARAAAKAPARPQRPWQLGH